MRNPRLTWILSLIIEPGNAEHENALGFDHALENAGVPIFGMTLQHEPKRIENFLDCLVELGLGRILGLHLSHDLFNVVA